MEKINLINILSLFSKILTKNANIVQEISSIDVENIDEQTRDSITSFEEQIILKAISDDSFLSYIKNNFIDIKIFDINYVIRKVEISRSEKPTKERLVQIFGENVNFMSKNREYLYYYFLSQMCIASADQELITLALNKLNSLNS